MNREARDKWTAALRSGKYEQGYDYLNSNDYYCCLGVLCEVAIESGLEIEVDASHPATRYDGSISILPDSVAQWAEIDRAGTIDYRNNLPQYNDTGTNFNDIADIIEKEF